MGVVRPAPRHSGDVTAASVGVLFRRASNDIARPVRAALGGSNRWIGQQEEMIAEMRCAGRVQQDRMVELERNEYLDIGHAAQSTTFRCPPGCRERLAFWSPLRSFFCVGLIS